MGEIEPAGKLVIIGHRFAQECDAPAKLRCNNARDKYRNSDCTDLGIKLREMCPPGNLSSNSSPVPSTRPIDSMARSRLLTGGMVGGDRLELPTLSV